MNNYEKFNHLILLIGTNPLPNFVVADWFLRYNRNIETIWLLHSEANALQGGTDEQAKNLEVLLRQRWEGEHESLRFPLEKVSLSDVSDAATIRAEVERKMLRRWDSSDEFHLNYTGGTKAMSTHVYLCLQELQRRGQRPFSYLDANNFRLVGDEYGIIADDLREKVQIDFAELIALHGFVRKNRDSPSRFDSAELEEMFNKFIAPGKKADLKGGLWLEDYLVQKIRGTLDGKLNSSNGLLQNWEIKKRDWRTDFELDVILLHGYHLTGLSCTISSKKEGAKNKGFEIIQRVRQIGGDEARAILVAGLERPHTSLLQEELEHEFGRNQKNILALGLADLRKEALYLRKIEDFVLGS
jgi:hypothetical protein